VVVDERTVVAGLKEALRVGTDRTVASTSRLDGYAGNPLIRIPLPDQLQPVSRTLRSVGLGGTVDEFELAMNRAAEKASGEALDVFVGAITSMTLTDAFGILRGHDTAATEYFRNRTEDELRTRFRPIVIDKLSDVGVYRLYDRVLQGYLALPLTTEPEFDPDDYVTQRALDGLFTVLGQEEKRIRDDPVARTTKLLQTVFSSTARSSPE
jgi:hypothetical protein